MPLLGLGQVEQNYAIITFHLAPVMKSPKGSGPGIRAFALTPSPVAVAGAEPGGAGVRLDARRTMPAYLLTLRDLKR